MLRSALSRFGISVLLLVFSRKGPNMAISQVDGHESVPLFAQQELAVSWYLLFGKRLLDIAGSLLLILLFAPALLVLALLVWLTSHGPIFYLQSRVTLGGKLFTIWKFRSLHVGSMEPTSIGRYIRRYAWDELPQFFNVLRGQMTLVGPRPHSSEAFVRLAKEFPGYSARTRGKAGLTGLSQVRGHFDRDEAGTLQMIASDNEYLENTTLLGDLWILWETRKVFVKGH